MDSLQAQAAIFDMDGVLIDSMPLHREVWQRVAQMRDHPFSEEAFRTGNGRTIREIIRDVWGWSEEPEEIERIIEHKEGLYWDQVDQEGVFPLDGVQDLLECLRALKVPCAVGTSADRASMQRLLTRAGLIDYFQAFASASDVTHGKPAPDIFLKAAEALHIPPNACVVFEDSLTGIRAAKAAGMRVVGLATTHSSSEMADADLVIHAFADFPYRSWFNFG